MDHQQQDMKKNHDDDDDGAAAAILELPPPPLPPARVLRDAVATLLAPPLSPPPSSGSAPAIGRIYVLMHGAGRSPEQQQLADPEAHACTPFLLDELRRLFAAAAAAPGGRGATADVVPVLPFAAAAADAVPPLFPGARAVLSLRGDDAARELARALGAAGAPPLEVIESGALSEAAAAAAAAANASATPQLDHHDHEPLSFPDVAVGGTFDRLHAGHRLLLAATALVAAQRVFAGVTADALLRSKARRELLQPYGERAARAEAYLRRVRPGLLVTTGALRDPAEPTQAELDPAMRALVVSRETVPGGEAINAGRLKRGLGPLALVVVGLVSGGGGEGEGGGEEGGAGAGGRERRREGEEEEEEEDQEDQGHEVAGKLSSTALREQDARATKEADE